MNDIVILGASAVAETTTVSMAEAISGYITIDNGVFIAISLIGMLGHAVKKFLSGQLSGNIIDYLFFNNPKRTSLAFLTTIATSLGLIVGEQIPTQVGAYLMLAFTTGYTIDSGANKDVNLSAK